MPELTEGQLDAYERAEHRGRGEDWLRRQRNPDLRSPVTGDPGYDPGLQPVAQDQWQQAPQMQRFLQPYLDSVRQKTTHYVPEVLGTPDLFGVQDLLTNRSFQRIWEGMNQGKSIDDIWQMPGNRQVTMTGGGGAIWGDKVDEELFPGWKSGYSYDTFKDVLVEKYRDATRSVLPETTQAAPPPSPAAGGHAYNYNPGSRRYERDGRSRIEDLDIPDRRG